MYLTPLFFPNFLKIQRRSFLKFLNYGIKKEIDKIDLFIDKRNLVYFLFYPKYYQLNLPKENCNECIIQNKTYSCELIIPLKLISKESEIAWIVINNIPVITNKCHFIINGAPRIVMSQITRAPGIYYHKDEKKIRVKKKERFYSIYYADIIAEKGNWLRLEIDLKNTIWLKVKKAAKVPVLIILQALGIQGEKVLNFLQYPILDLSKNIVSLKSQNQALLKLRNLSRSNSQKIDSELLNEWNINQLLIIDRFIKPEYYNLSITGRLQINKRLNNYNYELIQTLNAIDLLLATKFLLKVKNKIEGTDDIDNLKNKRVKITGELLQSQFSIGLLRLQRSIKTKILNFKKTLQIKHIFSSAIINTTLSEFFGINPLSQFMDEINPLATITHKRRVSSLGFGGVNRETATLTIRSIHPTLQGRICPIETPEGKNAGLVNSFSILSHINDYGFIETPCFKLYKGKILYEMGINLISAKIEDNSFIISSDFKKSQLGFLPIKQLPARIKHEIREVDFDNIHYITISRLQMLSIATSLIPFLEHNDANRILMGSNMQRQAVPLIKPECSLVGTGLESKIIGDIEEGFKSYSFGIINYLCSRKIILYNFINKSSLFFSKIENSLKYSKNNLFKKNYICFNKILTPNYFIKEKRKQIINTSNYIKTLSFQSIKYFLDNYKSSNQGTCSVVRKKKVEGEWVNENELLTNGISNYGNELALGYNLFVGYISWKGYNFEDAVVISKKLIASHIYTSTHIEKFKSEISSNHNEKITKKIKNITIKQKRKLNKNGIVKLGVLVYEGDILIGKVTKTNSLMLSPYRKLLYEILQKKEDNERDISFRVPKQKRGRITFISSSNNKQFTSLKKNMLTIHLMQNRIMQVGDKISGRHGNKGVISNILIENELPYLENGTVLDIILNPLGVPSRMNIGQVLECLLGLCSEHLKKRFKVIPFDETFGPQISRNFVYSKLNLVNIKTGNAWLFNLTHPGKNKVIDAYTGFAFDQPITIGKSYILKLIHLVEEKIHARSTGPYSLVTQQPLKGKSKKGGQRIGEMEVWALEGYGAAYTLHEILTTKSDDIRSRQKVMTSILNNESIKFGTTETFKVLVKELQSLCLNLQFFQ